MSQPWPSTLPNPSPEGYSIKPGDGREITKMVQGPRRIRRRFVNVPDELSITLFLTPSEMAIWNDFWVNTIDKGMIPIDMPLIFDDTVVNTTVNVIERVHALQDNINFLVTLKLETV